MLLWQRFRLLCRISPGSFLSLAGSFSLGAIGRVAGAAAPASGVEPQLCPSTLVGGAVASCAATAMPAGAVDSPAASAAVPGRQQRQEVSRSSRRRHCSSSNGTGRMKKLTRDRSPSPGRSSRRRRSPISLLRSLPKMTESRLLLPFLDVCLEVLLAILAPLRQVTACLVLALRAGDRGRPQERSGIAQGLAVVCPPRLRARRTTTILVPWMPWTLTGMTLSVSVLALIRNFHSMEEPAGLPSARCKTSLASIYGLMSETSPSFHLPTSPLMRSLLDDTNLALSKFLEDQTVHGFLPVPSRRHRRYYRTSSSSFPGPYSVPPGVTSITLEKASEARKRSVSL